MSGSVRIPVIAFALVLTWALFAGCDVEITDPPSATNPDTSSHDFHWEHTVITELDAHGVLHDICCINDTCIWAVGWIGIGADHVNACRWNGAMSHFHLDIPSRHGYIARVPILNGRPPCEKHFAVPGASRSTRFSWIFPPARTRSTRKIARSAAVRTPFTSISIFKRVRWKSRTKPRDRTRVRARASMTGGCHRHPLPPREHVRISALPRKIPLGVVPDHFVSRTISSIFIDIRARSS